MLQRLCNELVRTNDLDLNIERERNHTKDYVKTNFPLSEVPETISNNLKPTYNAVKHV